MKNSRRHHSVREITAHCLSTRRAPEISSRNSLLGGILHLEGNIWNTCVARRLNSYNFTFFARRKTQRQFSSLQGKHEAALRARIVKGAEGQESALFSCLHLAPLIERRCCQVLVKLMFKNTLLDTFLTWTQVPALYQRGQFQAAEGGRQEAI